EHEEYKESEGMDAPAGVVGQEAAKKELEDKPEDEKIEISEFGSRAIADPVRSAKSLENLSMDEAITFLEPLIRAESEDQVVVAMKNLSLEKARKILQFIIESSLPAELKIQIILGVSLYYEKNKNDQESLFAL